MSLKYVFSFLLVLCLSSCVSEQNNNESSESKYFKDINVENISYNHSKFEDLKKSEAQKYYVDYSYNFLQTSKFKRHLNTIGVLADTTNYEYIKRLSYSYKKAGEHQKAIHLMELAIEKETDEDDKLTHIGYAAWTYLYFYRDYGRAITKANDMLKKSNNDNGIACHGEPCLLIKGQALYRQEKYSQALQAFQAYQDYMSSQEFNPMDNLLVVFYKGRCLTELNQVEEAEKYFKHLVRDNPLAEAHFQLAKLYSKLQIPEKAKIQLDLAENAIQKGYTLKEPYFERFDKTFQYQIDEIRRKL